MSAATGLEIINGSVYCKPGTQYPPDISANDRAEILAIPTVVTNIVEAADDILLLPVSVGSHDGHHASTVVGDADFNACGILQSIQTGLLLIHHRPEVIRG